MASPVPPVTTGLASGLVEEAVRRQEALMDLASEALRSGPYPAFARGVVERVAGVLGAQACWVFELVEGDRLSLLAGTGRARAPVDVGLGSWVGRALVCEGPVVLEDVDPEGRFPGMLPGSDPELVGGVAVRIPTWAGDFGVLGVCSTRPRTFCEEEVRFVKNAAEVLGMTVERGLAEAESRRELEEQDRRVRAAEERFAFLSEATTVLTAAPDPPSALAATARLAVPALADWCFVDVVREDGEPPAEIRRLAVAGTLESPDRRHLAEDLGRRHYPMNPGDPHGTPKVLRTGRPEILPVVGREVLESIARDEEHLRVVRRLGPVSYMCVPLQVGRRLIGALGLVSTAPGRRYGEEDLALAEGLSRCAALVVRGALESLAPDLGRRGLDLLARHAGGLVSSVPAEAPPSLTRRQREVLDLLEAGLPAREIGARLVVAETTVRKHIRDLLKAFGAHSQREALFKARNLGLLDG